uniref:RRM domain-containing protein n=1 Tax=Ananas comosus var. bracteatus TaxID=296719 RepID=A0A6V7PIV0_ANACO|nr:unnamed protein product [Ananas comosus var. bracteatus]
MADSPRKRYSRSPSPYRGRSRSRSLSRGRSPSRSRSPIPRSRTRSRSGSRGRAEAVNTGNTLYVTGLSSRVTERDLEDHFTKEGKVVGCHLVVEPRTRASRGFAFVTMDTIEDAERCIKYLNQSVLEGRYITVEKKTLLKLCAANQDDEFIDFNLKSLQLDEWTALVAFTFNSPQQLINGHYQLSSQAYMSRRGRPRTPTPGNYLGLKNPRDSYRYGGRYRGGYGRDDFGGGYRRSPRRSPYRGGRDYSPPPRRSPYSSRSRRERSRSLPYSPYRSPDRGYGRRTNGYARACC